MILDILISILLPPLAVVLRFGFDQRFWINLVLTFLGYIPGLIHAIWVIAQDEQKKKEFVR